MLGLLSLYSRVAIPLFFFLFIYLGGKVINIVGLEL